MDQSQNYYRVEKAILYLQKNACRHPSLLELSQALHVSEFHLQRIFSEWAGVSPKQFVQFLHCVQAKKLLRDYTVEEAAGELGFSSPSRVYDLLVAYEGVTPGLVRSGGLGLDIAWGLAPSVFGNCFVAQTSGGVCKLSFLGAEEGHEQVLNELQAEWPSADIFEDQTQSKVLANKLSDLFNLEPSASPRSSFKVLAKGTPFQVKVWEALLAIKPGQISTYQDVAERIGQPSAVRAVASAIAKNPVGFLIPCHRVIRSTGAINQYRWGAERKTALLLKELA